MIEKKRSTRIFSHILRGLFCFTALSQLSCQGSGNTDLSISLSSKTFILIDAPTKSCYTNVTSASSTTPPSNDVNAVQFSAPNITFSWTKTQPLTVQWINFKLTGQGVSDVFSVTLGSDQLLYSFYNMKMDNTTYPQTVPAVAACPSPGPCYFTVTLPNAEGFTTNQCPFKIGGIPIADKSKDASGSVTITVYGTYQDTSGNTQPVVSKAYGDYFFKGSN